MKLLENVITFSFMRFLFSNKIFPNHYFVDKLNINYHETIKKKNQITMWFSCLHNHHNYLVVNGNTVINYLGNL